MALSKTNFFQLTCILIASLAALLLLLVVGTAVGFGLKRDFEVEVAEGGLQWQHFRPFHGKIDNQVCIINIPG